MDSFVKMLRLAKGISQNELARKSGLSKALVESLDQGRRDPAKMSAANAYRLFEIGLDGAFADFTAFIAERLKEESDGI